MDSNLQEKFSLIYDQYIEKIYRFVYLKVSSQEVAQDVTSKVFISGWESFKNQGGVANPRAFLYKIARNKVIDYYRSADRAKMISQENAPEIIDQKTHFYDKMILSSDLEMVKNAISNLKKDYQDVIIWHYLEEMSADEIAQIIDKTAGAVRVMIHRGLQMLRTELENL